MVGMTIAIAAEGYLEADYTLFRMFLVIFLILLLTVLEYSIRWFEDNENGGT